MYKQRFKVEINNAVTNEIQEAVDYYNKKQKSLGKRFYNSAKSSLKSLKNDALLYQIKYKEVRCIKITKFPYLFHYKINTESKVVKVYALICTYKDPNKNWLK